MANEIIEKFVSLEQQRLFHAMAVEFCSYWHDSHIHIMLMHGLDAQAFDSVAEEAAASYATGLTSGYLLGVGVPADEIESVQQKVLVRLKEDKKCGAN